MREPAHAYATLLRISSLGLGLIVAFLVLASCDAVKRHRTMTFFFDGVPPLAGEGPAAGRYDPNDREAARSSGPGGWTVHEPLKDCTQCHGSGQRVRAGRGVHLVAEVPQLCYTCHEEFTRLEGWVHGPVVVGDCLLCHEPHKTRMPGLLTMPAPALCYQCHDARALRLVENHGEASYANCIDCHEAHAGATKSLLRPVFLEGSAGMEYRSEAERNHYEQALATARSALMQNTGFFPVFEKAIGFVEEGQWWKARGYLEVIGKSDLVTDSERQGVADVLAYVIALLETEPEDPNAPIPAEAAPADSRQAWAAVLRGIRDERSRQERAVAEIYYRSIKLYRAGQLTEARAGFVSVLDSGVLLEPVKETAERYLTEIDRVLGSTER